MAIRAATTGHLILSTVHTKDAVSVLDRLRAMGVSSDHISSTLIGSVAQRLVRRVCAACREPYTPDRRLVASYSRKPPRQFTRGKGCAECEGTGYHGLAGVFEMFVPDGELAAMIARGEPVNLLLKRALQKGFRPLLDHALDRIREGVTTIEEVARRIPPPYF